MVFAWWFVSSRELTLLNHVTKSQFSIHELEDLAAAGHFTGERGRARTERRIRNFSASVNIVLLYWIPERTNMTLTHQVGGRPPGVCFAQVSTTLSEAVTAVDRRPARGRCPGARQWRKARLPLARTTVVARRLHDSRGGRRDGICNGAGGLAVGVGLGLATTEP
jgi:hypothetical protein